MKIISKRKLALNSFEALSSNEVLLSYFGSLNFELGNYLIKHLNKSLKRSGVSRAVCKKVYSSFVEGIENIIRHQSDDLDTPNYGIVNVGKAKSGYVIVLGNIIERADKIRLEESFLEIKSQVIDKLKETFSKRLENADVNVKSTAHLGLIQMAINSNNNIEQIFYELESGDIFFIIEMTLEDE